LTAREWRWLALVSLAVTLLADLPFLVSTLAPPEGMVAVYPSVVAAEDYPQYLGAMHDAVDSGTWHSIDHFSTETHRPVMLRPFYTALGLVARSSALAPEALYRAAVLLGRVLLCVAIYLFVAVFYGKARNRWLAFAIVLAVSGLLGLLDLASGALPETFVRTFEQRLERPESSFCFWRVPLSGPRPFPKVMAARSPGERGSRSSCWQSRRPTRSARSRSRRLSPASSC
jgi:hypothetical protein